MDLKKIKYYMFGRFSIIEEIKLWILGKDSMCENKIIITKIYDVAHFKLVTSWHSCKEFNYIVLEFMKHNEEEFKINEKLLLFWKKLKENIENNQPIINNGALVDPKIIKKVAPFVINTKLRKLSYKEYQDIKKDAIVIKG